MSRDVCLNEFRRENFADDLSSFNDMEAVSKYWFNFSNSDEANRVAVLVAADPLAFASGSTREPDLFWLSSAL